jgi:hypothetical protein
MYIEDWTIKIGCAELKSGQKVKKEITGEKVKKLTHLQMVYPRRTNYKNKKKIIFFGG